jgi:succinate-semialdehyde dehydrogenase/glutarate-semialdehyde dehydrogenase
MATAASVLVAQRDHLAGLVTLEMGKLRAEALAEVDKCALACRYYAEHGPRFLVDNVLPSDAARSFVAHQPMGTILAIMPWNFPLWQVFRFAAPALVAGNTAVLKHASNVPQCALAIEKVFVDAGFPANVFRTLMINVRQTESVIADQRIHGVTLTGSEGAGRKVAAIAGANLKKTVLELGGSDAFIVLEDALLEQAAKNAVASRFLNAGQSCIAAKRFIVVKSVLDDFVEAFRAGVDALRPGDPTDATSTLGPMARDDLREQIHKQVCDSLSKGARLVTGGAAVERRGYFYKPTILRDVSPGCVAFDEELFGPVAAVTAADNEQEAVALANRSRFGLGGSVWTQDIARGEAVARQVNSGAVFVNGMVKSDPRLPFGGINASGYGRELSFYGMHEFLNLKTIWIGG